MPGQSQSRPPVPAPGEATTPPLTCASLAGEPIPNEPSPQGGGYEKMARRRYQKPTPKRRGQQWTILVREEVADENGRRNRRVGRVALGPASLTKAEAERLRDDYLADVNQPNVGIGGACLFRDFARTYERDVLPTLASTTQDRSRSVLKNYLNPEFGELTRISHRTDQPSPVNEGK